MRLHGGTSHVWRLPCNKKSPEDAMEAAWARPSGLPASA